MPEALRTETELTALDDIKRVLRRPTTVTEARFDWSDDRAAERPEWIAAFLEMKTVWHPIGVVGTWRRVRGDVERRVFVHASPRVVWATLHDPALTGALFPEVRLGPAAPAWPAAATTRTARDARWACCASRPGWRASRPGPSRGSACA